MGWLDNSTNNIILDAVLTDYGRQALAKNDGSFNIAKFALGDDEVDYGIITKYGRTVGREKIEKNTPVFEAFTNQNLGVKYKLVSVPRPLLYLPNLTLTPSNDTVELSTVSGGGKPKNKTITIKQAAALADPSAVPDDLIETNFDVYVPDMFLFLANRTPIGSPDVNRVALYSISASTGAGVLSVLTLDIQIKSLSQTTFSVYGRDVVGGKQIKTNIKVVGKNSGLSLNVPVTISNF